MAALSVCQTEVSFRDSLAYWRQHGTFRWWG